MEFSVDPGFADIAEGRFDAGVRLGETIDKDMIAVQMGPDLRMVIAGSPDYIEQAGMPKTPADLASFECIELRFKTTGSVCAWEPAAETWPRMRMLLIMYCQPRSGPHRPAFAASHPNTLLGPPRIRTQTEFHFAGALPHPSVSVRLIEPILAKVISRNF